MTDKEQKKIFAKNLSNLINLSGKTQLQIAKETGFTNTTISNWCNQISMPTAGKIQTLADYFGVGKSALLDEQTYYLKDSTADIAESIRTNKELALLFDAARDADPEDLEAVHAMLLALKRKERG